ncbi:torsin-1A-interacting protein 2-like isoform 2-T2 [Aulostomus maculatus]
MAEPDSATVHQDTGGNEIPMINGEEETKSTTMDRISVCIENNQEDTDMDSIVKQPLPEDSASSTDSFTKEAKNDHGEKADVASIDPNAERERASSPTEGLSPGGDIQLKVVRSPLQLDDGGGDCDGAAPTSQGATVKAEEFPGDERAGDEEAASENSPPQTPGDAGHDHVDGPEELDEERPDFNGTVTEDQQDVGRSLEMLSAPEEEEEDAQKDSDFSQSPREISAEEKFDKLRSKVETIGPTTQETMEHLTPGILRGRGRYLIAVAAVVLVAVLVQHLLQPEPPPQKDARQIDIFLRQMEKVKPQFPNQRAELWIRSRIHLQRHLQTTHPTEPVSLILTAGLGAKRTLQCLAQDLASAFSSALNASVLHIDGASKASQDSDQVKLDIDSQLQGAFEGDKPVAVIHRFEELPPGSTLIFYRYCDHENAAYKKTFLIFTVLLGEEEEIPPQISLSSVEEMVDDHLQKKFLSHGHPVSFDRMDLDKYGGLWSRISHLILPVAAERRIEHEGCPRT